MKDIIIDFSNVEKLVEEERKKPTQEERLAALEELFLEQILMGGFTND